MHRTVSNENCVNEGAVQIQHQDWRPVDGFRGGCPVERRIVREPPALPAPLSTESWNTPGAAIPAVELPRIDGRGTVDLGTLRGRKLLLIHFASW